MESEFGLPKELVARIEAPMSTFTFDAIVERLDQVFSKGWSYHFEGPERIDIPKKVPKYPKAKNPTVFKTVETPYWQCSSSIEITTAVQFNEIVREYCVLVPIDEQSSYEQARDLSFIYAAHYGLGVGRKSKDLFAEQGDVQVELQIGGGKDKVAENLKEMKTLMSKLGLSNMNELDPFVKEWNSELRSYREVNRTNLAEFVNFLREKEQFKTEQAKTDQTKPTK